MISSIAQRALLQRLSASSAAALGKATQVNRTTLRLLANGLSAPSTVTAKRLAGFLGVPFAAWEPETDNEFARNVDNALDR
jgi:transcriptional regulator with XRE-family HTH domain